MSKWRENILVLECGCKIGGNKSGPYFYDFICEKHIKRVQVKGKYNYEKALKLTDELNRKIREGKLKVEVNQENV